MRASLAEMEREGSVASIQSYDNLSASENEKRPEAAYGPILIELRIVKPPGEDILSAEWGIFFGEVRHRERYEVRISLIIETRGISFPLFMSGTSAFKYLSQDLGMVVGAILHPGWRVSTKLYPSQTQA